MINQFINKIINNIINNNLNNSMDFNYQEYFSNTKDGTFGKYHMSVPKDAYINKDPKDFDYYKYGFCVNPFIGYPTYPYKYTGLDTSEFKDFKIKLVKFAPPMPDDYYGYEIKYKDHTIVVNGCPSILEGQLKLFHMAYPDVPYLPNCVPLSDNERYFSYDNTENLGNISKLYTLWIQDKETKYGFVWKQFSNTEGAQIEINKLKDDNTPLIEKCKQMNVDNGEYDVLIKITLSCGSFMHKPNQYGQKRIELVV